MELKLWKKVFKKSEKFKVMMRVIYFFIFLFIYNPSLLASIQQDKLVKGNVTDETNEPLVGVSVIVRGVNTGTVTDIDGNYSVNAPVGSILEFSYLGYHKLEKKVPDTGVLNVVMQPQSIAIDEVVVTAMGVKTEKKKLNFAVSSLDENAVTIGRPANFAQALQGKVAGVNVTTSGGSPTAGTSVIIRGIGSISQGNQPLYVLDGNIFSGSPSDINPNDIENITILKGAASSALYGQDGLNGVIMITTKQGTAGKLSVNASGSWQIDDVIRVPEQQTMYGPGSLGFYKPEASGGSGGWGPPLAPGTPIYNNAKNYFKQGLYQKYDVNINGGSDKFQSYTSLSFTLHDGTIVNNYLDKMTLLSKGTYEISKNLTAIASLNIVKDKYRGDGGVSTAYSWPITDDITDYSAGEFPRFRYLSESKKESSPISPLWGRYMDGAETNNTRNILNGSLVYKPVKGLQLTGRISYEQYFHSYEGYNRPRFDDSKIYPAFTGDPESPTYAEDLAAYNQEYYLSSIMNATDLQNLKSGDNVNYLGYYNSQSSRSNALTATGLVNYSITLAKDYTLGAMMGSEVKMENGVSSSMTGRDFKVPGLYHINNVEIHTAGDVSLTFSEKRKVGIFGELHFDYKGLASLSATYRADWSSTIRMEHNPYTYPSITGGLLFSELFGIANDVFSYGKLRANWASVGGDAPTKQFDRRYSQYPTLPDGGFGADPGLATAADNLAPQILDSWEVGADLRFFNNRTRLDVAYFNTEVYNQIVTVRVSPAAGFILQTRNEGWISNQGMEVSLEQDILKSKDFTWTAGLNYSFNRGKVEGLPDDLVELQGPQYGDAFPSAYLHGSTTALSGKDYLRTEDGKVIVDENGYPKINPTKSVLIGNREPDFLLGLNNTFKYKDFILTFLIDGRKGGDVLNVTARGMMNSGQHKMMETYRGRQVVWEGVVEQPDGSYKPNTTPIVLDYQTITNYYNAVSSNFVEDGSYIRLSYVTLQYDFSNLLKLPSNNVIKGLRASITGKNLFLLTKYTGSDPQVNADPDVSGTGAAGIDNYATPMPRSFNLTLSATF